MVYADSQWSPRATRGPALTVLALACLASFGHGLLGRGDILLSPPQPEPVVAARAEVMAPQPSVEAASLRPSSAAPRKVAPAREETPEPALAEAARDVPDDAQMVSAAPAGPAAPSDLAAATPSAVESGLPATEVAPPPEPTPAEPPMVETPQP